MLDLIDISLYTTVYDWKRVSEQKYGALIKSSQDNWKDQMFDTHWQNAGNVGMARSLWHFYQPNQPAGYQASFFISLFNSLDWKPGIYWVDCENISFPGVPTVNPPGTAIYTYWITQWLDQTMQGTGSMAGIYTRKYFWDEYVYPSGTKYWFDGHQYTAPNWSQYPLWVANYGVTSPLLPRDWKTWDFWQYSGDEAMVDGISSNVDLDHCQWEQAKADKLMKKPSEPPPPMTNQLFMPTLFN